MTVIHDEFGCNKTFVTARTIKNEEEIFCPLCNHFGVVAIRATGVYKGEGIL